MLLRDLGLPKGQLVGVIIDKEISGLKECHTQLWHVVGIDVEKRVDHQFVHRRVYLLAAIAVKGVILLHELVVGDREIKGGIDGDS